MFVVHHKASFSSDENTATAHMNFHSQFQMSTDRYVDNNNFIRINNVTDLNDRWDPLAKTIKFDYLDYTSVS